MGAFKLIFPAAVGTIFFVGTVIAVVVSIASPESADALTVFAFEFGFRALFLDRSWKECKKKKMTDFVF